MSPTTLQCWEAAVLLGALMPLGCLWPGWRSNRLRKLCGFHGLWAITLQSLKRSSPAVSMTPETLNPEPQSIYRLLSSLIRTWITYSGTRPGQYCRSLNNYRLIITSIEEYTPRLCSLMIKAPLLNPTIIELLIKPIKPHVSD